MITLSWIRFEWDLGKLSADASTAPGPFVLSRAESEDEDAVQEVVIHAFSMDTGWSDIQKIFAETTIVRNVRAGFQRQPPDCLIVRHGSRIIGASVIDPSASADNHLTTGPCVLHEYRGRGLGSLLLETSLAALRDAGLSRAYGVVRDKSSAARFLYPKFGGSGSQWSPDFGVAQPLAA